MVRYSPRYRYGKHTLPETNMETPKWPYIDYSPFKRGGYMGFHVSLGECISLKTSGELVANVALSASEHQVFRILSGTLCGWVRLAR